MIKYVAAFVQPLGIIQPSYLIHIVNCKSLSFNVFQNKSCYALSPTLVIPTVFHSSRKVQWLGKSQVLSRAIRFESTEIGFCTTECLGSLESWILSTIHSLFWTAVRRQTPVYRNPHGRCWTGPPGTDLRYSDSSRRQGDAVKTDVQPELDQQGREHHGRRKD